MKRYVEDFQNWEKDKPIKNWDYSDNEIPDIYKRESYPKDNPLSHKTHSFLVNWTWNDKFIQQYQTHGIDEIDKDIIKELSQYRASTELRYYRVIFDLKDELKYKNKLKSYCKNIETALGILGNKGYLDIRYFRPEKILVDTTLIPNFKKLDLIEEVICIMDNKTIPVKNPFIE